MIALMMEAVRASEVSVFTRDYMAPYPRRLLFSYWPLLERESTLNIPGNLLLRGVTMSYNAQL
jgi:hypothetical protein